MDHEKALEETIPIKSVSRKWKAKKLPLGALRRLSFLSKKPSEKETLSLHLTGLIEEEILSRLPVKSLLRFRCVSKPWRSLIDNNRFIRKHLQNYTNKTTDCDHWKTILECWDHGIRQHGADKSSYNSYWDEPLLQPSPINDPKNKHLMYGFIMGRCNGLLCVFKKPRTFFLWNPAIKIYFELPKIDAQNRRIIKWGFGWDEESDAYKVFVLISDPNTREIIAQLYSSNTNLWRRVECGSLHFNYMWKTGAFAFGKIHWLARSGGNVYIESFDLKSEVLGTIKLPHKPEKGVWIWMWAFNGSLQVVCDVINDNTKSRVWVMEEYGVKESVDNDNDGKREGRELREPWAEMVSELGRPRCFTAIFYTESLVSPLLFNKKN